MPIKFQKRIVKRNKFFKKVLAQTSLEFLYTIGFVLFILAIIIMIYLITYNDLNSVSREIELRALCNFVSIQVSAISITNADTASKLILPTIQNNYNAYVESKNRTIKISSKDKIIICKIPTTDIKKGEETDFELEDGALIIKNREGVFFED